MKRNLDIKKYLTCKEGWNEIEEARKLYLIESIKKEGTFLLDRKVLYDICHKYHLDTGKVIRLESALDEIEENEDLLDLYRFLVWDLCRYKEGEDGWFYLDFQFTYPTRYPDCRKFLLLLACLEPGEAMLKSRGIPEAYYEEIPFHRIAPQMEQYKKTGNCEVLDFPWDKNFYTRSIFLLDRFYFIPYKFGDPFCLYRNKADNRLIGIYDGGYAVRRDGQVVPERKKVEDAAFYTSFEENDDSVKGNYMNPCGILSGRVESLEKEDWGKALQPGDLLLALHIPSGEGYNPHRLNRSMELALQFYGKYFPEYAIKGFWSESWLYDNRLALLLEESTNIVSVQRRFYNYSIGEGGAMLRREIWHRQDVDPDKVEPKTALEKKVVAILRAGGDFCTTSMIVLKEDVARIEKAPLYITESDWDEFQKIMSKNWCQ
ncbi:MAG: hypothetical protein K6G30_09035 [Acetatifactor sp.]|nr:hypothetical protein [Acetatifactor sp.]